MPARLPRRDLGERLFVSRRPALDCAKIFATVYVLAGIGARRSAREKAAA
jgi:hypothetical protein